MALLMSGSLRFVITACKAVCLWLELLLRGKARPHRYLGKQEEEEVEEMKGGKRRLRKKSTGDAMRTIAKGAFFRESSKKKRRMF